MDPHRLTFPRAAGRLVRPALFVAGFVLLALAFDRAVGWYTARTDGRHLIGREVYLVQQRLHATDPAVRAVYLGDSVSRQLFAPGEEPDPEIKYITSNQAISMAGQYYLLRAAIAHYPNLQEVLLLYSAGSWRNNLDQVYTHDYFCGYFHEPEQLFDLFTVTHDWELLSAHAGRALFPNLTALNSAMSVRRSGVHDVTDAPEPRETAPAVEQPIELSHVSDTFLKRIRRLCAERRLQLRILPCPAPDRSRFADVRGLYDHPFLYLPSRLFRPDGVHVKEAFVPEVRIAVEQNLGLRGRESSRVPRQTRTVGVSSGPLSGIATATHSAPASPER